MTAPRSRDENNKQTLEKGRRVKESLNSNDLSLLMRWLIMLRLLSIHQLLTLHLLLLFRIILFPYTTRLLLLLPIKISFFSRTFTNIQFMVPFSSIFKINLDFEPVRV